MTFIQEINCFDRQYVVISIYVIIKQYNDMKYIYTCSYDKHGYWIVDKLSILHRCDGDERGKTIYLPSSSARQPLTMKQVEIALRRTCDVFGPVFLFRYDNGLIVGAFDGETFDHQKERNLRKTKLTHIEDHFMFKPEYDWCVNNATIFESDTGRKVIDVILSYFKRGYSLMM